MAREPMSNRNETDRELHEAVRQAAMRYPEEIAEQLEAEERRS